MCGEIRAAREVLPKESVRVFVGAALPGALGIAKIHLGVRRQGEVLWSASSMPRSQVND